MPKPGTGGGVLPSLIQQDQQTSHPNFSQRTKVFISSVSVISGVVVLGVSWDFLGEINQDGSGAGVEGSAPNGSNNFGSDQVSLVAVSVGMGAIILQLIGSILLSILKWKKFRPLLLSFVVFQTIIQLVLLICMSLILVHFLHPSTTGRKGLSNSPEENGMTTSMSHHGYWITIAGNVLFHILAIWYLSRLVMRGSDEEQMEELTPVVIHRRVHSRIPSEKAKRYARIQGNK